MTLLILATLVFLSLSGLMAAVDAAVLSVTHPEIEELRKGQRWGADRLKEIRQKLTESVVVVVIATNTINVFGPVLISRQAFERYSNLGVVIMTAALTIGTIVFSEILPKSIGTRYAPTIARLAAPWINVGRWLLSPIVLPLGWLSNRFTQGNREIGTEDQIRALVRIGHRAGLIESGEDELIRRVFYLNDKTAQEIMTPLDRVESLVSEMTLQQAAKEVNRRRFSRYPVFGKSADNLIGIAISRDIFIEMMEHPTQPLVSVIQPPTRCSAETTSDELLSLFRQRRVHLAVVEDQGKAVGIVTLEDVLEELVGEIEDEKDRAVSKHPRRRNGA